MQAHKLHERSEVLIAAEVTGILRRDRVLLGKPALKDEGTVILYNIF